MYDTPQLPHDFVSLPYANSNAKKGGTLKIGAVGSFDSLNPHIVKGRSPWQLRFWGYETLMGRSWDEPFTLYGLLAESIETGPNREWVEFKLRKEAKFSDNSPVTIEDVIWSYKTLGTIGHWRYRGLWKKIQSIEKTGPRSVKISFNEDNPELALLAGMRPILKKLQWNDSDFENSSLEIIPISTAAYRISEIDPGKSITMERNPDYWGNDLPFRKGTLNFDKISLEYFGDSTVLFEAFKAGEIDIFREGNAEKWETQFNFPNAVNGKIMKSEIPHGRPTGMRGLVMNTRKEIFSNWQVRQALIEAFNFEYINEAQNAGRQQRITSYFSNSILGMREGAAKNSVLELLQNSNQIQLPGTYEGYKLPKSNGSERNRANMKKALKNFNDAGFKVVEGKLQDNQGRQFKFSILLRQGAKEYLSIVEMYSSALKRLGIDVRIELVDSSQYWERIKKLEFDMVPYARDLSLSPGNEQHLYWSSEYADVEGTRNLMGLKSPTMDKLLNKIMKSKSMKELQSITRAMDRILMAGRYVIPIYHNGPSRIAHKSNLRYPSKIPLYGDRIGFFPDVWWKAN
ncbi:MAG: extracellular solute-binding protein [Paracoccaceae bacterium]